MSAFDYYKDAKETGMIIEVTDGDALDAILEHMEDAVKEWDWFEINPESAALLLAHIEALEAVDGGVDDLVDAVDG